MPQIKKNKVLLIEPNYSNKYPPIGLMKIATYYRNLKNWEVVFYKGDLKMFVIGRIVDKLANELNIYDNSNKDWHTCKDILTEYVKTRKTMVLDILNLKQSEQGVFLQELIVKAKNHYWKEEWKKPENREWDRVGVTTLFTFYWKITIDTINFAKDLVKDEKNLMVGGVLASIQPNEIYEATGIKPHVGILRAGDLDKGDIQNIDELELDYSILDEIDYRYPMANAYYRYTTRGCVNRCPFCAVPTLEPNYQDYIPLKSRIDRINNLYGEQKDLLLMDNNVLASKEYGTIIQEIIDCGFAKGAKFIQPNLLEKSIRNLNDCINDRAYIRKSWRLIQEFYETLKGEESYTVYCILQKYHIGKLLTTTKTNLKEAYKEIKPLYEKHHQSGTGKLRFVDFNQGLDARLFTSEKAELLAKTAIRPVRIAFDDLKMKNKYVEAVKMCVTAGLKDFSNYLLYNFNEHPDDLYTRLRINVDLCDELKISIYSFPMKFHPIRKTEEMAEDFSHNRDYIGKHWNRKYIRAIQAVLNSTKGKIGRGTEFFEKAFGKDIEEYHKLLEMPETMIIYRFFFEWLGKEEGIAKAKEILGKDLYMNSTQAWWTLYQECKQTLSSDVWQTVNDCIHTNNFENVESKFSNPKIKELLAYYINYRKDVIQAGTDLYLLKQEYDNDPIKEVKRHGKKRNRHLLKH